MFSLQILYYCGGLATSLEIMINGFIYLTGAVKEQVPLNFSEPIFSTRKISGFYSQPKKDTLICLCNFELLLLTLKVLECSFLGNLQRDMVWDFQMSNFSSSLA